MNGSYGRSIATFVPSAPSMSRILRDLLGEGVVEHERRLADD
jgi:hypothetical protein